MKQSAVEWLFNELWNTDKDKFTWHSILKKAKEMEDNSPKVQNKDSFGEISDEEIEEASLAAPFEFSFKMGAKWYREQLKSK